MFPTTTNRPEGRSAGDGKNEQLGPRMGDLREKESSEAVGQPRDTEDSSSCHICIRDPYESCTN